MLHSEKRFIYKNKYSLCVIKQILIQLEKEQEKNNGNNNSYRNTNNENSFTKEKNSHMSEKQVSFIRSPKNGQEGEKVIKSF